MVMNKRDSASKGSWTVLGLDQALDLDHSPAVREQLLDLIRDRRHLLVEFSAVHHIDSSGLACLIEVWHAARSRGLGFGLVGVRPAVRRVLDLARPGEALPAVPLAAGEGRGRDWWAPPDNGPALPARRPMTAA